jgi:hypothetical protein
VVVTDVLREQALGFVSNVYFVIGLGLALFILLIYLVRQKITDAAPKTGHLVNPFTALTSKWANLGAIGIFLYVGAEVAISLHLLLFLEQSRILDIPSEQAGKLTTFYMVFAMIGRFGGSALLKAVKDYVLLAFVAVGALALCLVVILTKDMTPTAHAGSLNLLLASVPLTTGLIPAFAALLIGLFNSIMFPTIFTLTLQRSSAPTSATSGLLCMAIVGGAFLPLAFAKIEEMTGSISMGFIAPLVCYVYVLWFAIAAKKAPTHEIRKAWPAVTDRRRPKRQASPRLSSRAFFFAPSARRRRFAAQGAGLTERRHDQASQEQPRHHPEDVVEGQGQGLPSDHLAPARLAPSAGLGGVGRASRRSGASAATKAVPEAAMPRPGPSPKIGHVDAGVVAQPGVDHGDADRPAQIAHQVEQARGVAQLGHLEAVQGQADAGHDAQHDREAAQACGPAGPEAPLASHVRGQPQAAANRVRPTLMVIRWSTRVDSRAAITVDRIWAMPVTKTVVPISRLL